MCSDNPTATYRGYRRQALYALYRLFDDALPSGITIQPEGIEDLAIYAIDGQPIEIVQVKDHARALSASSLGKAFYKRIARSKYCRPDSPVAVTIASYGEIGPDFLKAKEGDPEAQTRVIKTITKYGIGEENAKEICNHIKFKIIQEDDLKSNLLSRLRDTVTGMDSKKAFDFLMWWMLTSSEEQRVINQKLAIEKLDQIGKFVAARSAYHDEWYASVVPLVNINNHSSDQNQLTDEFYHGVSARFEHICMDLDVPRETAMGRLHESFGIKNVVIIRGASGQGKSVLAYRYCKEVCDAGFCFLVKSAINAQHARRIALAITGHTIAIAVPTLVFIDVEPGDTHWVEIVRELAAVNGIRILVAVREEDWQRSRVSQSDFLYETLELEFDQSEALLLYEGLENRKHPNSLIDFDETWSHFGGKGPLMEFVYFVTQAESLRDRIRSQIQLLQDEVNKGLRVPEELVFLRAVAVATSYEARVQLDRILKDIALPVPIRTLELYEKEYLLRISEDKTQIEALHPIRSMTIADLLTDTVLIPWSQEAARCLPWIDETDIENFLLCAFSRHPESTQSLLDAINAYVTRTWISACGIARSLLWLGLREYIDENHDLIEEIRATLGVAWFAIMDYDVGLVSKETNLGFFEAMKTSFPEAAEKSKEFRSRQTPREHVHEYLKEWLQSRKDTPSTPMSMTEHLAKSEIQYWIGRLDTATVWSGPPELSEWINGLEIMPIEFLGDYVLGVRECNPDWYSEWLTQEKGRLLEQIRFPAGIVQYEETPCSFTAHFLIDIDRKASILGKSTKIFDPFTVLNGITVERVELLSRLFPGKERCSAIGYGHRCQEISSSFDDTMMDIFDDAKKDISVDNIPSTWSSRVNATFRGLVEWSYRPVSWNEYFKALIAIRTMTLDCFSDLREAIETFEKSSRFNPKTVIHFNNSERWEECRRQLNRNCILPQNAVDEWGFIAEGNQKQADFAQRFTAVTRFGGFIEAVTEYFRTLKNFFTQAPHAVNLVPALRQATTPASCKQILIRAKQKGIREDLIRLSAVNLFDACKSVGSLREEFYKNVKVPPEIADLSELHTRETIEFLETLDVWFHFIREKNKTKARKKLYRKRQRKLSHGKDSELKNILRPIRNSLKSKASVLKKQGMETTILSEEIKWDNETALWLGVNVSHPVEIPRIPQKIWQMLQAAFRDFATADKYWEISAVDLFWSKIIAVPLVQGKSLNRQAWSNLIGAFIWPDQSLEDQMWRAFPDDIPLPAWEQLELEEWPENFRLSIFNEFAENYMNLLEHLSHMADFNRLPKEIDEKGMVIFQDYLDRESKRANPIMQAMYDSYTNLLEFITNVPDAEKANRPNMCLCYELLMEMEDIILPTGNFYEHAEPDHLAQVVDWNNRMLDGTRLLGLAGTLWSADTYDFPEYDFESQRN